MRTAQEIRAARTFGKPVIFGEQGNTESNWDPRSSIRFRLRAITSLFEEGTLLFWNSSYAKDNRGGGASNVYIGPEERAAIRTARNLFEEADDDLVPFAPGVSDGGALRAWGLRGERQALVYLHAFSNHLGVTSGAAVTLDVPVGATLAEWWDVVRQERLGVSTVSSGPQTLAAPPFTIDTLLRIQPGPESTAPDFTRTPAFPRVGEEVRFTSVGRATTDVVWDFGDGTTAASRAGASVTKVFRAAGDHVVVLRDATGGTRTRLVSVSAPDGTPGVVVVPAVVRGAGLRGAFYRTEVFLRNEGPSPSTARLTLRSNAVEGGGAFVDVDLPPFASRRFADVVETVFGLSQAAGSLFVSTIAGGPFAATTRTYTTREGGGTFGAGIPAVPRARALSAGAVASLAGLRSDAGFRTNLGIANLAVTELRATVRLTAGGAGVPVRVPPLGLTTLTDLAGAAGLGKPGDFGATVTFESGLGLAYATVLDETTNDPTYVPPSPSPSRRFLVAATASAPGLFGSYYRTDLTLWNRGDQPARVSICASPLVGADGSPRDVRVDLSGGQVRRLPDVLGELFAGGPSRASLELDVEEGTLLAAARVYNGASGAGSYGQGIGLARDADTLLPGECRVIDGFGRDGATRSNLVVHAAGSEAVRAEVPARRSVQLVDVFGTLGAPAGDWSLASVRLCGQSGRLTAFGSRIDNVTSDPSDLVVPSR